MEEFKTEDEISNDINTLVTVEEQWTKLEQTVWKGSRQIGPRQIGPRAIFCGKLGPGRLGPGKLGPGRLGPGKLGPGRLGPGKFWVRQIGPRKI